MIVENLDLLVSVLSFTQHYFSGIPLTAEINLFLRKLKMVDPALQLGHEGRVIQSGQPGNRRERRSR